MNNCHFRFSRPSIAVAVALAFPAGSVLADEVQDLTDPNVSDVTVRVQDLNKVNPLYRYFSGLNRSGVLGSLDIDIVKLDAAGDWLKVQGQDLGLPGIQEFGASYEKQGDWKIGLDYNEITKYSPYTINTKVGGVGSNMLNLNPDFRSNAGLGPESSLKLERTGTTLSGSKFLSDNVKFNFSVKSEDKKGEIMSSSNGNTWSGLTPANAGVPAAGKNYATQFFSPQPENYKHNQVSATIDYFTKTFQLSAGYYGSFFNNTYNALNITPGSDPSGTVPYASSQVPWISLPPDNHSQQLFVSGAYNFSDSTRGTFKLTSARLVQDDNFIPGIAAGGLNPAGVVYATGITSTNLGGLVDTNSAAGKVTSRLTKDLDLVASWRYEDRQDKTPIYNVIIGGTTYNNPLETRTTNNGKLELSYRLPEGYRITGGLDYDEKKTPGQLREEVHEETARIDLRKSMSETLNGWITLSHGTRGGGPWNLVPVDLSGATVTFPTATYVAAPLQFSDRTRDKARLMADWSPTASASIQLFYEHTEDKYTSAPYGNTPGYVLTPMGLLMGKSDMYGLDAAWAINNNWKLNAYYSNSTNKTHQLEEQTPRPSGVQTCAGGSLGFSCVPWGADLQLDGQVFGAGLKGSVARWDLNAKYLYSKDSNKYNISYTDPGVFSPVPAGAGFVPNTYFSINRLQLTGFYPYSKTLKFRLDYIYDVRKYDDYTWQNWTFADGTRVNIGPREATQIFSAAVTLSF